jgi:hypothetical protein
MHQLFSGLGGKRFARDPKRTAVATRRRCRPEVLPLEDRVVPSSTPVSEFLQPFADYGDSAATATPLPVADGTVIAYGRLSTGTDADWFKITTPSSIVGYDLWAYVDTGGVQGPGATSRDCNLWLFKSDGTSTQDFDLNDGTGNGGDGFTESSDPAVIASARLDPGETYYLRVRESGLDDVLDPYKLYVRVTGGVLLIPGSLSETEPNNVKVQADAIAGTEGSSVRTGSITDDIDRDYYSFHAQAGDKVFVALDGDPDRNGIGNDFRLRFFKQGESNILIEADSSDASTAFNSAAEAFSWNVATAGHYLVQVDLKSGSALTAEGNYRLLVAGNSHPGSLQFGAANYSVGETGGSAAIVVNRLNGDDGTVTVAYTVTGGSATAGIDYAPVGGTLTFASGETSKTIMIPIKPDAFQEGNETIVLTLSNQTDGAILGSPTQTVVTILDSATPPAIEVTPAVSVNLVKAKYNRARRRLRQTVMLQNVGSQGLYGPLMLVLDGLAPKVKLRNRTGFAASGSPYVTVFPPDPIHGFQANETMTVMLNFRSPRRRIGYTARVVAGNGMS